MTFEEFYTTYYLLVRAIISKLVHHVSGDLVEDLVQETFLKAWKAYGRLAHSGNLKAWISSIAHNTAIDTLRHEQVRRRRVCLVEASEAQDLPDEHDPAQIVYSGEADLIAQTLRQLSPTDQKALILLAQGHTYQEIAASLSLSSKTCKMRIMRARERFRETYGALCSQV